MVRWNDITIDFKNHTIRHRSREHVFAVNHATLFRFRLFCYFMLGGGCSMEMAWWHIYGNDPEGGPDTGTDCLHVMLCKGQKDVLDGLDLEWRSWKIAGVSFYEIVPKHQFKVAGRFSFSASKHRSGRPIKVAAHV